MMRTRAVLAGAILTLVALTGCASSNTEPSAAPSNPATADAEAVPTPTTEPEPTPTEPPPGEQAVGAAEQEQAVVPAPPAPAPEPAPPAAVPEPADECHPSYEPCVPIASDVDCEGGSGNGPAYTGRVSVIGPDEYDLDRDGDGVACEFHSALAS